MKKRVLLLFGLFAIVSLACSFSITPNDTSSTDSGLSADEIVATKVALTISPALSSDDIVATNVSSTLTAEAASSMSDIDVIATSVAATLAANEVASKDMEATQPSPPTVEPTVPAFPTNTMVPTVPAPPTLPPVTSTPTTMPTPTLDPNDPAVKYGAPSYTNGLDVESTMLKNFSSGTFEAVFVDGAYQLTKYQTSYSDFWYVSAWMEKDFYVEVDVTTGPECAGRDRYGLLLRAPDTTQGLILNVACDGYFRFSKYDTTEYSPYIQWTYTDAIKQGPNQLNRIGVDLKGQNFDVYINGVYVGSAKTTKYVNSGRIGFVIGSAESDNFTVRFDNLKVWKTPR